MWAKRVHTIRDIVLEDDSDRAIGDYFAPRQEVIGSSHDVRNVTSKDRVRVRNGDSCGGKSDFDDLRRLR